MQIFEIFDYNLNHIKFKNNKDFFDAMLKELGLKYSDIALCFHSDSLGSICDKAIKYFPKLEVYKQYLHISALYPQSPPEYRLSSIYTDKNGCFNFYIKKEHIDDVCSLIKKIPHSINFGFMGIVLDNVDWYAEETHKPTFYSPKERNKVYDHNFSGYFSNSIRFFKEYDYGNKLNSVTLMIGRTEKDGVLGPYPVAFSKMLATLGKPKYQALKCQFDNDEEEKWIKAAQKIDEIITQNRKENCNDIAELSAPLNRKNYLLDSVTPVTEFSAKTIFNKIAKKKGYKYTSYFNGRYTYCKQNKYNHTFCVEIMNIPFSSFFEVSMSVKGYNFKHLLFTTNQVTIKEKLCAEMYANKTFLTALETEKKYTELLVSVYGETPAWFVN